MKKLFRCVFLIETLWISTAYGLEINEFGVLSATTPEFTQSQDPTLQTTTRFSIGVGASFNFELINHFSLEPGFIYVSRSFSTTSALAPRTEYSLSTFQFPLLLRYWISKHFSLGGGPYLAHGFAKIKMNQEGNSTNLDFQDLQWSTDDLGFIGGIQYKVPFNELFSFLIEGRYLLGLKNLDVSGNGNFKMRDIQTHFGIAFNL